MLAGLLLVALATSACASPYVSIVRQDYLSGLKLWEYEYKITNDLPSGGASITSLFLEPVDQADIVGVPPNWDFIEDTRDKGSALWYAKLALTSGVGPGEALAGFVFQSPGAPVQDIAGWELTDNSSNLYVGKVYGPVVPEPGTWVMFLVGFAALVLLRHRQRQKSAE